MSRDTHLRYPARTYSSPYVRTSVADPSSYRGGGSRGRTEQTWQEQHRQKALSIFKTLRVSSVVVVNAVACILCGVYISSVREHWDVISAHDALLSFQGLDIGSEEKTFKIAIGRIVWAFLMAFTALLQLSGWIMFVLILTNLAWDVQIAQAFTASKTPLPDGDCMYPVPIQDNFYALYAGFTGAQPNDVCGSFNYEKGILKSLFDMAAVTAFLGLLLYCALGSLTKKERKRRPVLEIFSGMVA